MLNFKCFSFLSDLRASVGLRMTYTSFTMILSAEQVSLNFGSQSHI